MLGAAAEKDDDAFSISTEINAITGAEINLVLHHPLPTPFAFEKFPRASFAIEMATFAAARAFK